MERLPDFWSGPALVVFISSSTEHRKTAQENRHSAEPNNRPMYDTCAGGAGWAARPLHMPVDALG
eukprot:2177524-Pleurochrysis_carterae.AAC.1